MADIHRIGKNRALLPPKANYAPDFNTETDDDSPPEIHDGDNTISDLSNEETDNDKQ